MIKQMVQMKNRVSGLLMETGVNYDKQRLHNRATLAVAKKMVWYLLAVERRKQDFVPAEEFSRRTAAA